MLLTIAVGVPAPSVEGQGSWSTYLPVLMNPGAPVIPTPTPTPVPTQAPTMVPQTGLMCRFGITTLMDMPGYLDMPLINQLRSGTLMDWGSNRPKSLPAGMSYVGVIATGVRYVPTILTSIPAWVKRFPGATWQVGNEPDAYLQDNATPELYAEQFYAVATVIRASDSTAKIAFGTVVQPTPLRRAYLDRAWARLTQLAGGPAQASALVDIWTIHGYLLGEKPGEWGLAKYPPGMDGTEAPLLRFGNVADADHYEFARTHDVTLLAEMIRGFRAWMAAKGERAKPLYITEYGVAFPPIDPPTRDILNVSDVETGQYMTDTFDFFRTATDPDTGVPSDNNLLVQRWYWFSINDLRYKFGGSLIDTNTMQLTAVGQAYIDYTAQLTGEASCGK
jgi:hypothetical protein